MSNAALKIATHAPLLHIPSFFKAEKAYEWYTPDLEGAFREGVAFGQGNRLRSAAQLWDAGIRKMWFAVDFEADFRGQNHLGQSGRLPVAGMDDAVLRSVIRLINGTANDHFVSLKFTQDGHPPGGHVSFGTAWRDKDGIPLDTRAHGGACILDLFDEAKCVFEAKAFGPGGVPYVVGYYRRHSNPKDAVAYYKHLQATGQGSIWAFNVHCVLGTDGVDLHPLVAEAIQFFAGARSAAPGMMFKGQFFESDYFGPFAPCRIDPNHPQGGFNKAAVDDFAEHDDVEMVGVAEDFCVFHAKKQVLDHFSGTDNFRRLVFVTDGTAPIIPGAAHVIAQDAEARKQGVRFITHDAKMAA